MQGLSLEPGLSDSRVQTFNFGNMHLAFTAGITELGPGESLTNITNDFLFWLLPSEIFVSHILNMAYYFTSVILSILETGKNSERSSVVIYNHETYLFPVLLKQNLETPITQSLFGL